MDAPLLVTDDALLLDDLLRLSAAAGVVLDVAADADSALRRWTAAPLVLVGADLAGRVAELAPGRRTDVFLVSHSVDDVHFRQAVALGAAEVVALPAGEVWLAEVLADVGDGGARSAVTLGFIGGSGGVGTTTLACAVAAEGASQRRRTCLLDVDALGPGVERVVGLDEPEGVSWTDLAGSRGRLGSRALRDSLPQRGDLAVLGWGSAPGARLDEAAVREALSAAQRGHDLVVVDLPRHLDAVSATVAARCDHVVLVAGCSLPGAAASARSVAAVRGAASSVQLVARNTGGAVAPDELAAALGLPLVTALGQQKRLAEQLDLGLGPLHSRRGPVVRAARAVLTRLAPARSVAA